MKMLFLFLLLVLLFVFNSGTILAAKNIDAEKIIAFWRKEVTSKTTPYLYTDLAKMTIDATHAPMVEENEKYRVSTYNYTEYGRRIINGN